MNNIFDISSAPLFLPDYPYVILVGSVPLYGFYCLERAKRVLDAMLDYNPLVAVSLVVNVKYGDNKGTSDV